MCVFKGLCVRAVCVLDFLLVHFSWICHITYFFRITAATLSVSKLLTKKLCI